MATRQGKLFENANAIQSLRDSDFDEVSAYGEVIDNALDAKATDIRIQFDLAAMGKGKYQRIDRLAFGDNGTGMDAKTVANCLTIGWSGAYNKRDNIGRFGVGMTLAAIHECKVINVWSSQGKGKWLWTFLNLDLIAAGEQMSIPTPTKKALPVALRPLLADNDHGTLVVWSSYDRQSRSGDMILEDTNVWIGRTYRHFMWDDDVEISLNGESVPAIDPLYVRTDKTRFPDDEHVAEPLDPMTINWGVDESAGGGQGETLPVTIRMSILPEAWRPTQGSGGSKEMNERFVPDNEGISILRNKREVFYGHVPHWRGKKGSKWSVFEDRDRWWGCEVQFDARLDRAFTVKNIKRGAVPVGPLKEQIKQHILPTRDGLLQEISDSWKTAKENKRRQEAEAESENRTGRHQTAEQIAKATPTDKSKFRADQDKKEEIKTILNEEFGDYDERMRETLQNLFESNPFTIEDKSWPGSQFVDSRHLGGSVVLLYNRRHPFWEETYKLIEGLESSDIDATEVARELRVMMDLLLISYVKAEAKFDEKDKMTTAQWKDYLEQNWGQYLKHYIDRYRKADGED
jgi:hypothetical protein